MDDVALYRYPLTATVLSGIRRVGGGLPAPSELCAFSQGTSRGRWWSCSRGNRPEMFLCFPSYCHYLLCLTTPNRFKSSMSAKLKNDLPFRPTALWRNFEQK